MSEHGATEVRRLASGVLATSRLSEVEVASALSRRAGDAIHLASCLRLQQEADQPIPFVVFDQRLRTAADVILPAREATEP